MTTDDDKPRGGIGQALRRRRELLGISQEQLAGELGVRQEQVSRLERRPPDAPLPPPDILNPWARALGVSVRDVLLEAGYELGEAPVIDAALIVEMINRAQHLSPRAKRAIREVVDLAYSAATEPEEEEIGV